jgi:hypothetical protein
MFVKNQVCAEVPLYFFLQESIEPYLSINRTHVNYHTSTATQYDVGFPIQGQQPRQQWTCAHTVLV